MVDAAGRLIGILSLNDIVREAARVRGTRQKPGIVSDEVATTLAAICTPRERREVNSAARVVLRS